MGNDSMGEVMELVQREMEQEFRTLKVEQGHLFQLALNEAEALAWQTPVPLLVFPMLAYEKLKKLKEWNTRQKHYRQKANDQIALAI